MDIKLDRIIHVSFPNARDSNLHDIVTGIEAGSASLSEILFSSGNLRFGAYSSNKYEVLIYGISDVSNERMVVWSEDSHANKTYLFEGYVDSCKLDNFGYYRQIVAYDSLYWSKDIDVSMWWDNFWTVNTGTVTLAQMRNSLCDFIGLSYSSTSYFNDSLVIKHKETGISSLKFSQMLSFICELQCTFPNISRTGSIEFISLDPRKVTTHNIIDAYEQASSEFEEYQIAPVDRVVVILDNDVVYRTVTTGNSIYTINNNLLLYDYSNEEIQAFADAYLQEASKIAYTPASVKLIVSDFSIKCGDIITTDNGSVYVLSNEYSGNILVDQKISATGDKYMSEVNVAYDVAYDSVAKKIAETSADLELNYVKTELLDAEVANIGYLKTRNLDAENARIGYLKTQQLDAEVANLGYLTARQAALDYAEIDLANVNNAWIENGVIKDAAISNEMVNNISANKLTTGTLDASKIIVSNLNASNITTGRLTVDGITIDIANNSSTIDGSAIEDGTITLNGFSQEVINMLDGAIQTFSVNDIPTLNNYPAVDWTTDADRATHVGDIAFVVNTSSEYNGYSYRFTYDNTTQTYGWNRISDSEIASIIENIAEIQDDLDGIHTFEEETNSWKTETDTELSHLYIRTTNLEYDRPTVNILPSVYYDEFVHNNPYEVNGITWTVNNDGSVTATGTASGGASVFYCSGQNLSQSPPSITIERGKYYNVTGCPDGASSSTYRMFTSQTGDKTFSAVVDIAIVDRAIVDTSSSTYTTYVYDDGKVFEAVGNEICVGCRIESGYTCPAKGITFYPMLESGRDFHGYVSSHNGSKSITDSIRANVVTMNEIRHDVDTNSATITTLSSTVTTKADNSTVTALSNTVNTVEQTADANRSTISNLTTTLGTNADGTTTQSDVMHRMSSVEQDLSGFKTTVSQTYQTKNAMTGYSTTSQMNSAIQQSANSITQSVSETYQTKSDMANYTTLAYTNSQISQLSDEIDFTVQSSGIINILPFPYFDYRRYSSPTTINGIVWTLDDFNNTVKATGTASADSSYYLATNNGSDTTMGSGKMWLDPGTYTLSGCQLGGSASTFYLTVLLYTNTSSGRPGITPTKYGTKGITGNNYAQDVGEGVTFTLNNGYFVRVVCVVKSSVQVSNIVFKPMLERGYNKHNYVNPGYGAVNLISEINMTPDAIKISAEKINIEGAVSFTSLDSSLQTKVNGSLKGTSSKIQYALSTSSTTAPTSGWKNSPNDLNWSTGNYIWTRTATSTTATDGTTNTSTSDAVYDKQLTLALSNSSSAITTANTATTTANSAVTAANNAVTAANNAKQHYGTCDKSASTQTKTVTCSGFVIYTGVQITVKFTYGNTKANPILNVNGTGNYYIYVNGSNITSQYYWKADDVITFTFDGSHWVMDSTQAMHILATWCDDTDTTLIDGGMIATGSITAEKLTVADLKAIGATIGGFTIGTTAIYNGKTSISSTNTGVYVGTNGIAVSDIRISGGKIDIVAKDSSTSGGIDVWSTKANTSERWDAYIRGGRVGLYRYPANNASPSHNIYFGLSSGPDVYLYVNDIAVEDHISITRNKYNEGVAVATGTSSTLDNRGWGSRIYLSGVKECWGFINCSITASSAYGHLYSNSSVYTAYFPNGLFTAKPTVTLSAWANEGVWVASITADSTSTSALTKQLVKIKVASAKSYTSSKDVWVYVHAIGY